MRKPNSLWSFVQVIFILAEVNQRDDLISDLSNPSPSFKYAAARAIEG